MRLAILKKNYFIYILRECPRSVVITEYSLRSNSISFVSRSRSYTFDKYFYELVNLDSCSVLFKFD